MARATAGDSQEITPYKRGYQAPNTGYGTADCAGDFDPGVIAPRLAGLAGDNIHTYREGVKTHKESGEDSKRAQLETVLTLALRRYKAGCLFDFNQDGTPVTDNLFFNQFLTVYNSNSDQFEEVCIQINATDKETEPQVLSLEDGYAIKGNRLVYELYLPGGWPDFRTYEGSEENLLNLALASFHIEKFLEANDHRVEHYVGVAPKEIEDMVRGHDASLTYAHCKSGRGRGPFTPIVVQALRFLHESEGQNMEDALTDFEAHNKHIKKLITPYSCKCISWSFGIPAVLAGLVVGACELYRCEQESVEANGNGTTVGAITNETALWGCIDADFASDITVGASIIPVAAAAIIGARIVCQQVDFKKFKKTLVGGMRSLARLGYQLG